MFSVRLHRYVPNCLVQAHCRVQRHINNSFHGRYSSGCIESATHPSPVKKSSRTTLHSVMQNDGARDLVLRPLLRGHSPNSECSPILQHSSITSQKNSHSSKIQTCSNHQLPDKTLLATSGLTKHCKVKDNQHKKRK